MRLGRDVAASLGYSLLSMVVSIAVVPFYLIYLGVEGFGLIGFNTTLQGVLQILEVGLGPAISREVARATAAGDLSRARMMLRSLAWIYWGTATAIALLFLMAAPLIADEWLNETSLRRDEVVSAVLLMGLLIACRWPSALYYGALTGGHRIVTVSMLGSAWLLVANLGALAVLAFWSPTVQAFFLWQAAAALAYTLVMQGAAWRSLGGRQGSRFDLSALKSVWRFALGMSGVAITAAVFTQLDKLILSNMVTLTEFGYFMLATLLGGVLYRLIAPLFNVVFPRLSTLVAKGDEGELSRFYRTTTALFTLVWFPASLALVLCAEPLLLIWTGDAAIAQRSAPLMSLLVAGTALHGVMYFPYALQLAYGLSRLPLTINLLLLVMQLPLIIALTSLYGALGAAAAWLALHTLYVLLGTFLTHRKVLSELGSTWLIRDVGTPLAVSAIIGAAAWPFLSSQDSPVLHLLGGIGAAFAALLISIGVSPYKPRQLRAALAA